MIKAKNPINVHGFLWFEKIFKMGTFFHHFYTLRWVYLWGSIFSLCFLCAAHLLYVSIEHVNTLVTQEKSLKAAIDTAHAHKISMESMWSKKDLEPFAERIHTLMDEGQIKDWCEKLPLILGLPKASPALTLTVTPTPSTNSELHHALKDFTTVLKNAVNLPPSSHAVAQPITKLHHKPTPDTTAPTAPDAAASYPLPSRELFTPFSFQLRLTSLTEDHFFKILDHLEHDAPFYGRVTGYTFKRCTPLSQEVLEKVQEGESVPLFEGTISMTALSTWQEDTPDDLEAWSEKVHEHSIGAIQNQNPQNPQAQNSHTQNPQTQTVHTDNTYAQNVYTEPHHQTHGQNVQITNALLQENFSENHHTHNTLYPPLMQEPFMKTSLTP